MWIAKAKDVEASSNWPQLEVFGFSLFAKISQKLASASCLIPLLPPLAGSQAVWPWAQPPHTDIVSNIGSIGILCMICIVNRPCLSSLQVIDAAALVIGMFIHG